MTREEIDSMEQAALAALAALRDVSVVSNLWAGSPLVVHGAVDRDKAILALRKVFDAARQAA